MQREQFAKGHIGARIRLLCVPMKKFLVALAHVHRAVCATEEVFAQLLAHYLHALDCGRILHALRKSHHVKREQGSLYMHTPGYG